jgi:carotenoid cleavage dioxygenase-like enzyme
MRVQNGTYLRNGPGLWDVGNHAFHHLFDGYATLVRVSFVRRIRWFRVIVYTWLDY